MEELIKYLKTTRKPELDELLENSLSGCSIKDPSVGEKQKGLQKMARTSDSEELTLQNSETV